MIYLIKDREYLKIGYTTNIKSRIATYKTHNPHIELLAYKEGLKRDETKLHSLCSEFLYSTEGFHNNQKVIDIFNSYTSIVETLGKEIKQDMDDTINKWIALLEEDFTTHILSLGCFKGPMFSKNISKFFYDIRHLKLSEEQHFYKNFYYSYVEVHNIDVNKPDLFQILPRVQLLLQLFTHNYIQKDTFQNGMTLSQNIYTDALEQLHTRTIQTVIRSKEKLAVCKKDVETAQQLLEDFEASLPEYRQYGEKYFGEINDLMK